MTQRKRLEGTLASWHPHPKAPESLVPVVRDAGPADEIADRFFDSAPQLHTPEPPFAVEAVEPRVAIDSAAVRARRRYLMRYVAGAVSVASLIGLAAIVRLTTARDASAADGFASHRSSNTASNAASVLDLPHAEVAPTPMASAIAMEPPAATDVVPAVVAAPSESATEGVAALAPAAPASGAASDDVAAVAPPAPAATEVEPSESAPSAAADAPSAPEAREARAARDPGSDSHGAAEAKRESQRDLEHGRFTKSIAAGERSVSLDPTDADAWLVLGAAYQAKGRFAEARRCFATCSHRAKRGARGECRALLR